MKSLDLCQMEVLEGGVSCEGGLGATVGFMVAGLLIASVSGGVGLAFIAVGYGSGLLAGMNCGFGQN